MVEAREWLVKEPKVCVTTNSKGHGVMAGFLCEPHQACWCRSPGDLLVEVSQLFVGDGHGSP